MFDGPMYGLGLNRPDFLMVLAFIDGLWMVGMQQPKGPVRDHIARAWLVDSKIRLGGSREDALVRVSLRTGT